MSFFSEKIKKMRMEMDMTQKEFADAIGISQGNYSGLETGKFEPSLAALKAIAQYYGVWMDELCSHIYISHDDILDDYYNDNKLLFRKLQSLDDNDRHEVEKFIEYKYKTHREMLQREKK